MGEDSSVDNSRPALSFYDGMAVALTRVVQGNNTDNYTEKQTQYKSSFT